MDLDTYQGRYFPELQAVIFNALRKEYQSTHDEAPDNVKLDNLATKAANLIIKELRAQPSKKFEEGKF
jgi:hypothetical protein